VATRPVVPAPEKGSSTVQGMGSPALHLQDRCQPRVCFGGIGLSWSSPASRPALTFRSTRRPADCLSATECFPLYSAAFFVLSNRPRSLRSPTCSVFQPEGIFE